MMQADAVIRSRRDDRVFIRIKRGHFVTSGEHINYYVGTSDIKHNHEVSVDTAMLMAQYYVERGIEADSVLCLYETQALGAYLAHELSRPSLMVPNPPNNIFVLGPEYDQTGNIIFRDNLIRMIEGKRVIVLISCITSGGTVERAIESVNYYNGYVVGISAAFSAKHEIYGIEVNSIFNEEDLPDYHIYSKHSCPLCRARMPIDALANGYGYSKI